MNQGTLFLVRHAQSGNNAKPECERVPDPGITEIGVEQSQLLASAMQRIAPTQLYCSPFLRSLQTTHPVAEKLTLPPTVRQDLYEQGGCYQGHVPGELLPVRGKGRSEIAQLYPHWEMDSRIEETGWNNNPCYESREMAIARAQSARTWYETCAEKHEEKAVAMIIHADFILRMLESFLEIEDAERHFHDPANTSITCLSKTDKGWKLRYFNSYHHLPNHLVTY